MSPTKIEWTEETWNPVTGCTKVSAGCDHCYAERITERFHGKGSFEKIVLHPDRLELPLRWRKPRTVFVNSMSDLFHADVPRDFIERVWDVMAATPQHTYQILTKRPGRMRALLSDRDATPAEVDDGCELGIVPGIAYDRVLPNVWLGISCENQETANKRIPLLVATPAAVRFLSCEPLLGPIDLDGVWGYPGSADCNQLDEWPIQWVIVGGESGPGARPMNPAWARSLRDQCGQTFGKVAFFFKQWGEYRPGHLLEPHVEVDSQLGYRSCMVRVGKKDAGRKLDGRTWDEMPDRAGSLF